MLKDWLLAFAVLALVGLPGVARAAETTDGPPSPPAPTSPREASGSAAVDGEPSLSLLESLSGSAKAEYVAAKVLYDDGDYAGALTKLEVAHRLSSDPRLLWNMAAAEKNLRRYSRVIELLGRYLETGGPLVTTEDRQRAVELRSTMQGFVSEVTLNIQPDGTSIELDGRKVGTAPLDKHLLVDFGEHELRLSHPGYEDSTQRLAIEGGKPTQLTVQLEQASHEGKLRVVTDPKTAIRIDNKIVGVGMWQGVLPHGTHTVQLEAKGKIPQTTEVVIGDGADRALSISLRDEPASGRAAGGIPTWVWITGGVAAAAALGTGAYFVFRKDDEAAPIQEGSWYTLEL